MAITHRTEELRSALESFDSARDGYLAAFRKVPAGAMSYVKQGDDYSLGGIAVHVAFVIEHYSNVLSAIEAAGFSECRSQDPPGLEAAALAKAKAPLAQAEVESELAETERLHAAIAEKIGALGADWSRKTAVFFGEATETYSTAASDVLEWLTGHYQEHIPHLEAMVADWDRAGSGPSDPVAVVTGFNEAFARGDVDAVMALMTPDCVFENTSPAPDGERFQGAEAVRTFWNQFFASTEAPRFETEEMIALDDRVVARWRFSWGSGATAGHVRGVDLFRVRDGKVAEKLAYVKG